VIELSAIGCEPLGNVDAYRPMTANTTTRPKSAKYA
jgi:hypothetical protein